MIISISTNIPQFPIPRFFRQLGKFWWGGESATLLTEGWNYFKPFRVRVAKRGVKLGMGNGINLP